MVWRRTGGAALGTGGAADNGAALTGLELASELSEAYASNAFIVFKMSRAIARMWSALCGEICANEFLTAKMTGTGPVSKMAVRRPVVTGMSQIWRACSGPVAALGCAH